MATSDLELGACIDRLYLLRGKRRALESAHQAKLYPIEAEEKRLETSLIESFGKAELDGAKGRHATAAIKREVVASVKDWPAFCAFVAKQDAWDMVQRRVNNAAYRERLADEVVVPGLEPFVAVKLSVTKR